MYTSNCRVWNYAPVEIRDVRITFAEKLSDSCILPYSH